MINRRTCKCGKLCAVATFENLHNWSCSSCMSTYPFTKDEDIEWEQHQKSEKLSIVSALKSDKSKPEVIEKIAEVTAKIVVDRAEGKQIKEIAKDVGLSRGKVGTIAVKEEKSIEERKEFLVQQSLKLAEEAHNIIQENNYNKLRTLDGYKLTLSAKIAGQGAIELGGGQLQNLNVINIQALVDRVSSSKKNTETIENGQEDVKNKDKAIEEAEIV